jgi:hypothetical protein
MASAKDFQDQRQYTRLPLRLEVEGAGGQVDLAGCTRDVSIKGAYLFCPVPPSPALELGLTLVVGTGPTAVRLPVFGRVVRTEPGGVAVIFTEMEPETYDRLCELMIQSAPDAAAMAAELQRHLAEKRQPPQP